MKIMHFISSRGMGRGEVYIDLVNELSKNITITLLIPKNALYKKRIHSSIEIIEYHAYNSRNNPLLLLELWWKIKKNKPDMVHTHFVKASKIFKLLNNLLKIPHIATKHNPRKGKVFNTLPHVIAVSKGVKESIKNNNVDIIYNGVNPIETLAQKKNKIFTLLAVGRLDKIKGYDILINECSKLNFPFQLHIVGDGEERDHLEKLIKKLNLDEQIKLLGFREEIPQLMRNADVVVMSSHSEGFSLVMVESLFYANLFISTKVSGAIEILDDEFLYEHKSFSEKISNIYKNYNNYVDKYTHLKESKKNYLLLSEISQKHIDLYKKLGSQQNEYTIS